MQTEAEPQLGLVQSLRRDRRLEPLALGRLGCGSFNQLLEVVHGDALAYDSDRLAGGRTGAFTNPGRSQLRDPHHRRVTSFLVNIRCETTRDVGSTTL
ncbi:hypothetical protein ACIOWI_24845 [Streptomyces sp. NPDC087659]|uniref:hypothetical protein n=1 Tax=Streptomyces sp. NPDC087659 TaxID=3365801 RepID=UPI00381D4015